MTVGNKDRQMSENPVGLIMNSNRMIRKVKVGDRTDTDIYGKIITIFFIYCSVFNTENLNARIVTELF